MHPPSGVLSPVRLDDEAPVNPHLPIPPCIFSYTTDVVIDDAISPPDEEYEDSKAGWDENLRARYERDTFRYDNFHLTQKVTSLRNELKHANLNYANLEQEHQRLSSDLIQAQRDAHVYLVELYKATGSVTVFKDDAANRRALNDAQEWLHRQASRLIKAEMKAQRVTDPSSFHVLVHLPAGLPDSAQTDVNASG